MMPVLVPLVLAAALTAADPAPQAAPVVHLTAADVKARTAGGDPLLLKADGYKVMQGERTKTGEAEVHDTDTDVFYVIAGAATFVTGGTVVDGKVTAPGETRGPSIQGGETKTLAAGDVLVIPAGTPHWFKSVDGRIEYFVAKVTR
jgi:mannose-6-phosphate isomerase-like protein (cupin superfamily)